jgi:DNA-binding NarL/FixJ family response regulator
MTRHSYPREFPMSAPARPNGQNSVVPFPGTTGKRPAETGMLIAPAFPDNRAAIPDSHVTDEDGQDGADGADGEDGHRPGAANDAARVLVCEDIPVMRNALATLLGSAADIDVAGTAGSGMEAIIAARQLKPDVVVTGLNLRGIAGTEMIRRMRGEDLNPRPQIVVFAVADTGENISDLLRAGVSGVLDENASPEDLISAVRLSARGQIMLAPNIAYWLVSWFLDHQGAAPDAVQEPIVDSLTPREREVMSLIARGLTAEEIAVELTIGVATARTHIYRVRCKLGARDRAQVVALAYRSGLMQPRP